MSGLPSTTSGKRSTIVRATCFKSSSSSRCYRFCVRFQARESDVGLRQVEALRALPWLDQDATINALMEELPVYLVAATNAVLDGETSRLKWWKRQVRLPTWQHVAMVVFTLLPSSAPAERVFSLLQASIGHLQGNMLSDQIEASLMLQYNCGNCSK